MGRRKDRVPCPKTNCLQCPLPDCTASALEVKYHPDKIDNSLIRLLLCQDEEKLRGMKRYQLRKQQRQDKKKPQPQCNAARLKVDA